MLRPPKLVMFVLSAALLGSEQAPAPSAVGVRTFKFRPDTLVVPIGATVRWTNEDEIEHTVTADGARRGGPRGVLAGKSASYAVRFGSPGDYPYFCARHEFMRGVVRVTSTGDQQ